MPPITGYLMYDLIYAKQPYQLRHGLVNKHRPSYPTTYAWQIHLGPASRLGSAHGIHPIPPHFLSWLPKPYSADESLHIATKNQKYAHVIQGANKNVHPHQIPPPG